MKFINSYDLRIAAVWNTTTTTEIYILSREPSSFEIDTFEALSQSFIDSEPPSLELI